MTRCFKTSPLEKRLFYWSKISRFGLIFASFVFGCGSVVQAETFQEALISAYQTNPSLKAERARVKEADENYIQARAQGRPTSSFTASAARQAIRAPNNIFFSETGRTVQRGNPRTTALQIIQPIYQGGRVSALKRQANSGILAARQTLRNAEQNLLVSTATAYVDVIRDEQAAKIRRNNVSVLARQEQAARDRFDVGEGTLTDIAQAQTRLAAANIGLAQADAQLEISRATYERTVGHPPVDLQPVPEFILPSTVSEAQSIGTANNPQLLALQFNREAALAGRDVASSAGKPTFSLNASFANQRAQISSIREADSASLTAQLTIPLYSGGANKSRVRQAMNTVERISYEEEEAENSIKEAVRQVWAQLDAARRTLMGSKQQVTAAEVAFEGVKLEQQVGTRDTLDVLNAEQELLDAKLSVVNAERMVDATVYQLLSIIGGFDADSINLPVDLYDPSENLNMVKNDGLKKAVDRFVPHAVKKIAPQIPNIPNEIIGFVTHNPVADEVKTFGSGIAELGGTLGESGKKAVDVITFQNTEVKRLELEENNPSEDIKVEPMILSGPDWTVPPTIESSEN